MDLEKNDPRPPGKPDVVLPKYHTVIFIRGYFWHRHPGCNDASTPKTRTAFWEEKFSKNFSNDIKHKTALEEMGYHVIVLWECEINKYFEKTMSRLLTLIDPSHLA